MLCYFVLHFLPRVFNARLVVPKTQKNQKDTKGKCRGGMTSLTSHFYKQNPPRKHFFV